jgi:uncharacterized protein (TIGR02147 family)
MRPDIFTYLDYRHYLADLYSTLKTEDPSFSLRAFAKAAGSTSPNFFQLIRDRKLNIGPANIVALSRSLDLSKKEEEYFETIAAFDHAKTHEEKDRHFHRMLVSREYRSIKQLEKEQYVYFSHWYIPVIRELVTCPGFTGVPGWIAERIIPPISESKIRKGIALLESLGMIKQEGGKWVPKVTSAISTPSEVISLAVVKYHKDVIALARESIERFGMNERDLRSVTIGVSMGGFDEIKKRMEAFWKELMAFAETQKNVEQVLQVNMQVFPLTKPSDKEGPS